MTEGSPYRYWIADTLGGAIRATPPLTGTNWTKVLNGVGTFTGRAAARHPDTAKIVPVQRSLYVTRGRRCVWGGMIWTATQEPGSLEVEVGAAEFGSYFAARRLLADRSYTDTDELLIAQDLVTSAQGSSGGDQDLGIQVDGVTSGVLATRNYIGTDRSFYGDLITNLANSRPGFRISWPVDLEASGFVRKFSTASPSFRRIGLRIDERLFAASPGLSEDGTEFARRFEAIGEGEGDSRASAVAVDTRLSGVWPLLDAQTQFSGVSVLSTLENYARAGLARSSTPRRVPTIPLVTAPGAELGTYGPGDEVKLSLDLGWRSFEGWQRIAAMKVTPAGAGERVDVSFVDPANYEVS